nr:uncharacterized protein CTRU02_08060 [Colletotrichum truncatum]KAF6790540.1 hypothetical protein CTRU02_08060 [Colletotrichum truncatum]
MSSTGGTYGSVAHSAPVVNGDSHTHGDEEQPLLGGGSNSRKPPAQSLRKKLTTDVQRDWADLVLLACYIITGLLDSSSISIWGSFVSMQTGKHGLYWPRTRRPHRINPLDQVRHIPGFVLPGFFRLQRLPSLLLAEASLGALCVLYPADFALHRRRRHSHLRPHGGQR